MLESLGARLRQQREQRGIDLVAVADQTKIKRSLLEGLERDDVSGWPSGIFRRAYVRTYAQAVGLEPDAVVRQFLQAHPEPAEVAALAEIASLADGARANGGSRLRDMMGSALGSFSLFRRSAASDVPRPMDPVVEADPVIAFAPPDMAASSAPAESLAGTPAIETRLNHAPADVIAEQTVQADVVVPRHEVDLLAAAHLCTEFGRVGTPTDAQLLLQESARVLGATGLIVWIWDESAAGLRPSLGCGYPARLLAQLPTVGPDADNATAEAFRSAETCVISGGGQASGALVLPLLEAGGCAGALALEFQHGREQSIAVRALATILAASVTQLVGRSRPAEPATDASAVTIEEAPPPILRTGTRR